MDFYHVLNRGINKDKVFLDDSDRMRFIKSLYVFNDSNSAPNVITQKKYWEDDSRERDKLVHIHAWCLMNNHYHLLVSPMNDDLTKLSLFMKKLNGGYAKFFNEKYERTGYVWQGKYKKIRIEHDSQFLYIPYYIHLNPLDFEFREWREGGLKDFDKAKDFLDLYRWSSWFDYTDKKNFPSILYKSVLSGVLGSRKSQLEQIKLIIMSSSLAAESNYIET